MQAPDVIASPAVAPIAILTPPVVTPAPSARRPIATLSSPVVAAPNAFSPAAMLQVPPEVSASPAV